MTDTLRAYPIVLFWSIEDEAWIANVPDLRYCSAHGETPEEAVREIQIAMALWLDVAKEDGRPLPIPSRWDGLDRAVSG